MSDRDGHRWDDETPATRTTLRMRSQTTTVAPNVDPIDETQTSAELSEQARLVQLLYLLIEGLEDPSGTPADRQALAAAARKVL